MNATTGKQVEKDASVSPDYVVRQLGYDTRNAILVVSLLINAFIFTAWLVIQVSNNFDDALIAYLQSK